MDENEINRVEEIFDKYDENQQNSATEWQMQEILQEYGISISDKVLFQYLIETGSLNGQQMDFSKVLGMIQYIKKKNYEEDQDTEVYYSWIAVGGSEDKSGRVPVGNIENLALELGLEIDMPQLLREQMDEGSNEQTTGEGQSALTELNYVEFGRIFLENNLLYE